MVALAQRTVVVSVRRGDTDEVGSATGKRLDVPGRVLDRQPTDEERRHRGPLDCGERRVATRGVALHDADRGDGVDVGLVGVAVVVAEVVVARGEGRPGEELLGTVDERGHLVAQDLACGRVMPVAIAENDSGLRQPIDVGDVSVGVADIAELVVAVVCRQRLEGLVPCRELHGLVERAGDECRHLAAQHVIRRAVGGARRSGRDAGGSETEDVAVMRIVGIVGNVGERIVRRHVLAERAGVLRRWRRRRRTRDDWRHGEHHGRHGARHPGCRERAFSSLPLDTSARARRLKRRAPGRVGLPFRGPAFMFPSRISSCSISHHAWMGVREPDPLAFPPLSRPLFATLRADPFHSRPPRATRPLCAVFRRRAPTRRRDDDLRVPGRG